MSDAMQPPPLTYSFDHPHGAPRDRADLLGGKGANLAEMTSVLQIPVPPGFTITTEACLQYLATGWPTRLDAEIAAQIAVLEKRVGRKLGNTEDPLLLSVRSGARHSMPGMLDTVLNLGLNPLTADGLARQTEERFAYDSFRRFILMYSKIVLGFEVQRLELVTEAALRAADRAEITDLSGVQLRALCTKLLEELQQAGSPVPSDPRLQLREAIEAVFSSWNGERARTYRIRENIPHHLGTAVNVQAMVFGNRDELSGTGVAFTRDAASGDATAYGDFLVRAQGEDVVAGIRKTGNLQMMKAVMPDLHAQLLATLATLERHYRDMCDTEFTVESGRLWMLQTRVGKRTARAALRMAVDMVNQPGWQITPVEAVGRFSPGQYEQLAHPSLAKGRGTVIAEGLPASPGAAIGKVCLTAEDCMDAASRDEPAVLVRAETSPEDVHGMQVAQGILTSRGGLVSHAAVVARGWNIPAVVGAEAVVIGAAGFRAGAHFVRAGEVISLDGSSGEIYLGAVDIVPAGVPQELAVLLSWAAEIAGLPPDSVSWAPRAILEAAHERLRSGSI